MVIVTVYQVRGAVAPLSTIVVRTLQRPEMPAQPLMACSAPPAYETPETL